MLAYSLSLRCLWRLLRDHSRSVDCRGHCFVGPAPEEHVPLGVAADDVHHDLLDDLAESLAERCPAE